MTAVTFLAGTSASIRRIFRSIKGKRSIVKSPFVVGVAGGTGSGKTTVARKLVERFKEQPVRLIPQDAYYKDLGTLALEERTHVNFDHPLAFDNDLLVRHLDELIEGRPI
ncbi:MAG: zeta toxin family protein, partial [Candidatus Eremiobacteraeota bacterium]|nr:zeta toxin family protein [Candidatus Eremiobacteraeota bacterium]